MRDDLWLCTTEALRNEPPAATPEPVTLGPLAKRNIYDAIRGAYDLGYNDARNARTVPGDSAPGYDGRSVEEDHGGALFNLLSKRLTPATPEPVHHASGMTADELWLQVGRLRAQMADAGTKATHEPVGEPDTVPLDALHAAERERDYWKTRARAMLDHAEGTCWYWMGDGEDHLESLVNSLPVVIRADQLRELLARPAPGVPAINYDELIRAAFAKNRKWAQGTNGCVAFAKGAEWFRDLALAAAQAKGAGQ